MKRYMVFAFYGFYPSGGMNDFKNSYDTWEDAKEHIISNKDNENIYEYDYYHIYDTEEDKTTKYETDGDLIKEIE